MTRNVLSAFAALVIGILSTGPAHPISFSVKPGEIWQLSSGGPYGPVFYDVYCDTPGCQFQLVADLSKVPWGADPGFTGVIMPAKTCGYEPWGPGGPPFSGSTNCGFIGDSGGTGDWYSTRLRLSDFRGSFTIHAPDWSILTAIRPIPLPASLPLGMAAIAILSTINLLKRRLS